MRIGVVGAGVIGSLRAQSIRTNTDTELAAVMDLSEAAAVDACAGSGRAVTNLDDFLSIDMDAVIVSSPPHVHADACVAAFERGLHVLVEKPLSNSVDGARRIVDAAVAADRVLSVGFNMRYYPSFVFVKDTVDSGAIGELSHIRVFGGHVGLSEFRADWQYQAPESGGGAMMDIGIHLTDMARHLLGEITEVYGLMSESVWHVPGSEDNAIAVLKSPEGIAVSYHATWDEWKGYQFFVEAYGTLGMVRGSYAPMQNLLITRDRPGGPLKTQRKRYLDIMIKEKLTSWLSTALPSFEGELRDFVAETRGSFDGRLADGHAGLRAIEIAAAVRESTETGEAVTLPELGRMRS